MVDPEILVETLTRCVKSSSRECSECSYPCYSSPYSNDCVFPSKLLKDCLDYLVSEKPRVLSYEEVLEYANVSWEESSERPPLYAEYHDPDPEYIKWLTANNLKFRLFCGTTESENYGKGTHLGWRCWTSKPSSKLLLATPWENENE